MVVVPDGGQVTARRLSVSRSIDVRVTGRRTLDSQGVVPLALAVPALLGLLVVAIGVRRRRA